MGMNNLVTDNERFFLYTEIFQPAGMINTTSLLTFRGQMDAPAFGAALDAVIRDNESLRTTFIMSDNAGGAPSFSRVVHPALPAPLLIEHLPGGEDDVSARLTRERLAERRRRFDIFSGPLFSVRLMLTEGGENYALLTFHHVIVDSHSQNIFIQELAGHYNRIRLADRSDYDAKNVNFSDFLDWYATETLRAGRAAAADRFWPGYLDGYAPIALRRDRSGPLPSPFSFETHWVREDIDVGEEYAEFTRRHRIGMSVPPFAAFALLLRARGNNSALSILNVTSGRENGEHARIIGLLAGSTFVRANARPEVSLGDFMMEIQGDLLDSMDWGAFSLADSMRGLVSAGIVAPTFLADPAIPKPLYNFLDHQDALSTALFDELDLDFGQDPEGDSGAQEISLMVRPRPTGLTAWLGCWTHYYDPRTIAAMARDYEACFKRIILDPSATIGEVLQTLA